MIIVNKKIPAGLQAGRDSLEWGAPKHKHEDIIMDFGSIDNQIADAAEYNKAHETRTVIVEIKRGDKVKVERSNKEYLMYLALPKYTRKTPVPFDKEVPTDDFFLKIASLKPLESDIFKRLVVTRDKHTNICLLATPPLKKAASVSRALKGLREKEIVRRVKKGEYQINPWGIVPPPGYRIQARALWDSLKKEKICRSVKTAPN